jgi:DNA/RNA-binding domain of Phe-tRNA-synthetase-like protein
MSEGGDRSEHEVPAGHTCRVAAELRDEFPQLGLVALTLPAPRLGRSSRGVRERLDHLASRFYGADALVLRRRPVPHAYRVFFRHIGLDPDETRIPVEAAAVQRLLHGGYRSEGLLDDALTIALVETGVPLWALDAAQVEGELELRLTSDGDRLGRAPEAASLPPGRIVVADGGGPLAVAFGDPAPGHGATRSTRELVLYALRIDGVPELFVDEALTMCADILLTG